MIQVFYLHICFFLLFMVAAKIWDVASHKDAYKTLQGLDVEPKNSSARNQPQLFVLVTSRIDKDLLKKEFFLSEFYCIKINVHL